MAKESSTAYKPSNSYNIFILVLTVLSLLLMVVMFLPLSEQTLKLLSFYDNLICVIFLGDFFFNLAKAEKKSDYFIRQRGWLDLLGSIPSLGLLTEAGKFAGLLRLARLSRLARITRLLRGENKKKLISDVLQNRSQYAAFITVLLTLIVLSVSSVLVLQFESASPDGKILTGWDAFWYSMVTITTVGYGDFFPITVGGRITAMFIMIAGMGIIGVLASLMSSLLLGTSPEPEEEESPLLVKVLTVEEELAAIKNELAALRQILEKSSREDDK